MGWRVVLHTTTVVGCSTLRKEDHVETPDTQTDGTEQTDRKEKLLVKAAWVRGYPRLGPWRRQRHGIEER